jgi:hypothetical protein
MGQYVRMENTTYIPTYDHNDFESAVADGEHANAAIIASTISEDPALDETARQGWVDAAWKQYWLIPEDEGCVRADVLECIQPNGAFAVSAPSHADGFLILDGSDIESVTKAISTARCTGSMSATFRDGDKHAEVHRLPFSTPNHVGPVTAQDAAKITGDRMFNDIEEGSLFFICKDTLWWYEQMADGKFHAIIERSEWIVETQEEIIKIIQDNYFI